jgi:hypothetical protein
MNNISVTGRWVMVGVASLTATCAALGNVPSASELLDRYTQALESTKSFTCDWEASTDYSYSIGTSHAGKGFQYGQTRHDDQRIYHREYSWGNMSPRSPDVPKSAAHYHLSILNGKTGTSYQHSRTAAPGTGEAARFTDSLTTKVCLSRQEGISYLVGYVAADERLDTVLRGAERVSVRAAPENVGGSDCWVIEAHTKYGQYTLWLDPQHGYHPARVTQKAGAGEQIHGHLLGPGDSGTAYVKNVRFEQVAGVWVPMEAEAGFDRGGGRGHVFNKENIHYRRMNVVLNPNHDALGSFSDPLFESPKNDPELVDGTTVRLGRASTGYIWRNGQVVPDGKTASPTKPR